jgi:hypothetical protein
MNTMDDRKIGFKKLQHKFVSKFYGSPRQGPGGPIRGVDRES